ncbi:MAG TPA: HipA domain-containing protein [Polyangiaceae bacterium]
MPWNGATCQHASSDLEQLWRRIVFFSCVSNTDDHLRNHGFMLEVVSEVTDTVKEWRSVATSHGFPRAAQDRMRRAFRVADGWARR